MIDKQSLIDKLNLLPHPEGGYYKEMYRSEGSIPAAALPHYSSSRNYATSIYFLLDSENFSSLHRIKQDELWYFHSGSGLTVHVISPEGQYNTIKLGSGENEDFQAWVPGGSWFGATVDQENSYALVSCAVAPGFDFADFELGKKEELSQLYPQHIDIINRICRE